jgi:phosphoglycerate dehydrogenase-like enzyme
VSEYKVRILGWTPPPADSPAIVELREKGALVEIVKTSPLLTEAELIELTQDWDAVIVGMEPFTRRVIESLPRLKTIARTGVGYNTIDVVAAHERGVAVTITPGANRHAVADHAIALILMLSHKMRQNQQQVAEKRWLRVIGNDFYGKTLGIIGVGAIGKEVARRAQGFDVKVLGYDLVLDADFAQRYNLEYTTLPDLLSRSDFITMHVPSTPATYHLIGADELALVKPTAYLINTARGEVLDETALYAALTEKRLAGAGLDVMENEPNFDSPLLELDNVICTPHVAGVTEESRQACLTAACHNVWNFLTGQGEVHHAPLL